MPPRLLRSCLRRRRNDFKKRIVHWHWGVKPPHGVHSSCRPRVAGGRGEGAPTPGTLGWRRAGAGFAPRGGGPEQSGSVLAGQRPGGPQASHREPVGRHRPRCCGRKARARRQVLCLRGHRRGSPQLPGVESLEDFLAWADFRCACPAQQPRPAGFQDKPAAVGSGAPSPPPLTAGGPLP
jgi:hypothetical protein